MDMTKSECDLICGKILDFLVGLRNGTEISTTEAFFKVFGADCLSSCSCTVEGVEIKNIDFFAIDRAVRENAGNRDLVLDGSKYSNQHLGLPYNIRYVIKKSHKTKSKGD